MKRYSVAVATILASLSFSAALACGDSLYRAGKGVSYRTYSAPLPGNLLIFGTSGAAKQLADELARTGHDVQYVSNTNDLEALLEGGNYDVVIAPFGERASIESANSGSSFLPIAAVGSEEKLARKTYRSVMVPEKHEIKHYLKAIHRALKDNA